MVSLTQWDWPEPGGHTVFDPNTGNLWYTENANNRIARFNPTTNELTEWTIPIPNSAPCRIDINLDTGMVFFTMQDVKRLGMINPDTNGFIQWFLPTNTLTGLGENRLCAMDIDQSTGEVYITNSPPNTNGQPQKILKVNTNTNQATVWSLGNGVSTFNEISVAEVGGTTVLYFTEDNTFGQCGNCITQFTPSTNEIKRWATPQPNAGRGFAEYDPNTNSVYYGQSSGNRIAKLDISSNQITQWLIPTLGSNPYWIKVDSAGTVYFSESNQNKIGRLDPNSNLITEWSLPNADSKPGVPIVDNSDDVYFTQGGGPRIGKISG